MRGARKERSPFLHSSGFATHSHVLSWTPLRSPKLEILLAGYNTPDSFCTDTKTMPDYRASVYTYECMSALTAYYYLFMFHQILFCVVMLIIMTRWCSARSGMQVKIRESHKPSRVKKINSIWRNCSSKTHKEKIRRGYCEERAPPTYRKTVRLHLSKLGFFLTVLGNGTIRGVNYTYCQQNDRCRSLVWLACGIPARLFRPQSSGEDRGETAVFAGYGAPI